MKNNQSNENIIKKIQKNPQRKFWGMSASDLLFLTKNNYSPISKTNLISGVLVGFRGTSPNPRYFSPWRLATYYHADDELNHMSSLINNTIDLPSGSSYDYFIMDVFGNLLHSNCEISTKIDDNEIIHISSKNHELDHVVYPAQTKQLKYKFYYCCGDNYEALNNHINALIEKNIIRKPKNFNNGFNPKKEQPIIDSYLER